MNTHTCYSLVRLMAVFSLLAGAAAPVEAQSAAAPAATAPSASLLVRSQPTGASVDINGKTMGVTPLTLPTFAPGKHLLALSLKGYRPLYETVTLNTDERRILDLTLEPLHGLVVIHSNPTGADVEINATHRGSTPLLLSDLPLGVYQARISKSGYLTKQIDVQVEDRSPKKIEVALASDMATLVVTTIPEDATISLDGTQQKSSPCRMENVRTGNVNLSVMAPGYYPHAETLALLAGEVRERAIALRPQPSALNIITTPAGARIFVNDQSRGRSPVKLSNLPAGSYNIRTELEAHDPATRQVTLGRGQEKVEELVLIANAGKLEITTEPAGVQVLLNGRPVGETTTDPDKTDKISLPLLLPLVPVGTHELTLTKTGYFSHSEEITIARNETHTDHYTLPRRFIPNCMIQTRTDTYKGLLIEQTRDSVRVELSPGIFKTFPRSDILSFTPLRVADPEAETTTAP